MASAFTPSVVSTATMPTSMTDAEATRLGLKVYSHGTTYNGGIAPTVTFVNGGGTLASVDSSKFIPYQMQDGSWRFKFNVRITLSSTSRTNVNIRIAGVDLTNVQEAIYGSIGSVANPTSRAKAESTDFYIEWAAAATHTNTIMSGDIPLNAKPTWAY